MHLNARVQNISCQQNPCLELSYDYFIKNPDDGAALGKESSHIAIGGKLYAEQQNN